MSIEIGDSGGRLAPRRRTRAPWLRRILGLLGLLVLLRTSPAAAESPPAFLLKWGSLGSGNGQFREPVGIAVDAAGNVLVADLNNDRIQKFSSTGVYITEWGSLGTGPGQFDGPTGIAFDAAGDIYVTDQRNSRVEKFTSDGAFLMQWGAPPGQRERTAQSVWWDRGRRGGQRVRG